MSSCILMGRARLPSAPRRFRFAVRDTARRYRITLATVCLIGWGAWRAGAAEPAPDAVAERPSANLLTGVAPTFAVTTTNAEPAAWQATLGLTQADVDKLIAWEMPSQCTAKVRYLFPVGDLSAYVALALKKSSTASGWFLNGRPVPTPLPEQRYATVPGIPTGLLQPGTNELIGVWDRAALQSICHSRKRLPPADIKTAVEECVCQTVELVGVTPEDLTFQSGPVLGFAGADYLTLACRMNLPVPVTLHLDDRTFESPAGFYHRFKVEGLKPDTVYAYRLSATCPGRQAPVIRGPFNVRTPPAGATLNFIALGDNRSHPDVWGRVAQAVAEAGPMFVLHTGDIVVHGLEDSLWDSQCFQPAERLFATIPTLAAAGNHEHDSAVYYKMFSVPDGDTNWTCAVGPALFVGVNEPSSNTVAWLDGVLAASQAPFVFVVCHYPIVSSSQRSPPIMREAFAPVLAKHRVTAEIAGHDHYYERSEMPEGFSVIVTGGAGADLYAKKESPDGTPVNPYSQAYRSDHHYCVFNIASNVCALRAVTLDGAIIDRREWPARTLPPTPPPAPVPEAKPATKTSRDE